MESRIRKDEKVVLRLRRMTETEEEEVDTKDRKGKRLIKSAANVRWFEV